MTDPILKISTSSANSKNSIKAVVDEHGIPLGAEIQIGGVGISLPVEQFSSKDSENAYPRITWNDGRTHAIIFIDTAHNISYVRNIQDHHSETESIQEVQTVVVYMESGAKVAGGIKTKLKEDSQEDSPSLPAENIMKGALNIDGPKIEEAKSQIDAAPVDLTSQIPANNLFRSGIFCLAPDEKTGSPSVLAASARNNVPAFIADNPLDLELDKPTEVQEKPAEIRDTDCYPQLPNAVPLFSGAAYMVTGVQTNDGDEKRAIPVNPDNGSARHGFRVATISEGDHPLNLNDTGNVSISNGTDTPLSHPFAAKGANTHPLTQHASPPPIVVGDEVHNPVGAPVAPPPAAVLTILGAAKMSVIHDIHLVESPSPSAGSDGESQDQHEKQDEQQNPQDEYPSGSEEQFQTQ